MKTDQNPLNLAWNTLFRHFQRLLKLALHTSDYINCRVATDVSYLATICNRMATLCHRMDSDSQKVDTTQMNLATKYAKTDTHAHIMVIIPIKAVPICIGRDGFGG